MHSSQQSYFVRFECNETSGFCAVWICKKKYLLRVGRQHKITSWMKLATRLMMLWCSQSWYDAGMHMRRHKLSVVWLSVGLPLRVAEWNSKYFQGIPIDPCPSAFRALVIYPLVCLWRDTWHLFLKKTPLLIWRVPSWSCCVSCPPMGKQQKRKAFLTHELTRRQTEFHRGGKVPLWQKKSFSDAQSNTRQGMAQYPRCFCSQVLCG